MSNPKFYIVTDKCITYEPKASNYRLNLCHVHLFCHYSLVGNAPTLEHGGHVFKPRYRQIHSGLNDHFNWRSSVIWSNQNKSNSALSPVVQGDVALNVQMYNTIQHNHFYNIRKMTTRFSYVWCVAMDLDLSTSYGKH